MENERVSTDERPVALLTGAAGGIGRSIAERLAVEGYRLSLAARDVERLRSMYGDETDARLHAPFDAFDPPSAEAWVRRSVDVFGRIDALVNCAGIAERVTLLDEKEGDDDKLDRLWAVNVKAPLRLTRLCVPHLAKGGRGRIVNIASLAGKRVRGSAIGYAMTKHALIALTHDTRAQTWDMGIRASAICSGWVATDMAVRAGRAKVAPEDMTQPETVADLVHTLIGLPNNAAVAEVVVNCEWEDLY